MENNPSGTDDVLRPSGPNGVDSRRGGWWFPLLLLGIVVGMACLGLMGQDNRPSEAAVLPGSPAPMPTGKTVRLQVDFGNGATKDFAALAWHEGMTIADLMEQARRFRPQMQYRQQRKGPAADRGRETRAKRRSRLEIPCERPIWRGEFRHPPPPAGRPRLVDHRSQPVR